eukprot:GHVR01154577.1.p1 GENE.GHVR01154577.1~~GHVR01154577.1.p1  ORF type:complete len:596 (+),score=196.94 GHVR01154577.1:60-1790(+)
MSSGRRSSLSAVERSGRIVTTVASELKKILKEYPAKDIIIDDKVPGATDDVLALADSDWIHGLNAIYNSCYDSIDTIEDELELCQFLEDRVYQYLDTPLTLSRSYNDRGVSKYKVQTDTPLVGEVLQANGYHSTDSYDWQVLWSGGILRDSVYEQLHQHQRVNHFPGSTELTRKDRLWANLNAMQLMYGKKEFDFVPETFVLPEQYTSFIRTHKKYTVDVVRKKKSSKVEGSVYEGHEPYMWISKPQASSRGRGIYMIGACENPKEFPDEGEACIVQRYISDPLLIQGLKFDLRIYVLVTSFDPLTVYVFKEGLTRFASSPFSLTDMNKYKHLTNYSINKNAPHFVRNVDAEVDNIGHKWSLCALNKHLKCMGIDINLLWGRIGDLIVKSLMTVEHIVVERCKQLVPYKGNCFEVFGFDVLLDSEIKPWLLEVNLSPSLIADSPLDRKIKTALLCQTLTVVGMPILTQDVVLKARYQARMKAMQKNLNKTKNDTIYNNKNKNNKKNNINKNNIKSGLYHSASVGYLSTHTHTHTHTHTQLQDTVNVPSHVSIPNWWIRREDAPQTSHTHTHTHTHK